MKTARNLPTAFRFDPSVKEALFVIADRDGRSMANMLEWLIRKHCERECLVWPPTRALANAAEPSPKGKAGLKKVASKERQPQASKNSKQGTKKA
jgi:hypothetical protein